MDTRAYVAVDLGAESGRVIVGTLSRAESSNADSARLELHEVHRFTHEPVHTPPPRSGFHWNLPHIWNQMLVGLGAAGVWARGRGIKIVSVGVDTWGVDFVLLDARGELFAPPRCYRDARHESGMAFLRQSIGFERLYEVTGVQEMSINTLSQLGGAIVADDQQLERADRLLLMPDYFHFLLSGNAQNEASIASTTQMLDATTGGWSADVLSKLGVPARLFRTPIPPGTSLGRLRQEIARQTGLPESVQVTAPGSHDTASAVAGAPVTGENESWAYLSSGTWSLMGVELDAPILTEQARRAGFTNERGVANTVRFHKNLIGLWLVQEVRRDLERLGTKLDYAQLTDAAAHTPSFRTRIDAAHSSLAMPGGAIDKIRMLARASGDPEPTTPGELARCCLESLAMAYRRCLDELESLTREGERGLDTIHVVGGGSRNELLNQMTADATGLRVLAGPAEATAAGNVLVQAMTDGQARDLASIRAIAARSFEVVEYLPRDTARWNQEYTRYRALREPHT